MWYWSPLGVPAKIVYDNKSQFQNQFISLEPDHKTKLCTWKGFTGSFKTTSQWSHHCKSVIIPLHLLLQMHSNQPNHNFNTTVMSCSESCLKLRSCKPWHKGFIPDTKPVLSLVAYSSSSVLSMPEACCLPGAQQKNKYGPPLDGRKAQIQSMTWLRNDENNRISSAEMACKTGRGFDN